MKQLLIRSYRFFQKRKLLFYTGAVMLFLCLGFLASRVKIEEDVNRLLPDGEQTKQITEIFKSSNFADKVIVKFIARKQTEPETLIALADSFESKLRETHTSEIASIKKSVSDETALAIYNTVLKNLPAYLEEGDYRTIDSLTRQEVLSQTIRNDYDALISAQGMMLKKLIADDPVGIFSIVLSKLRQLQTDDNYVLYDGYIMSKDKQNLYLFITLKNTAGETGKNEKLFKGFDKIIGGLNTGKNGVEILYYGNPVVAAGNARQLKRDSIITLSITVVAILLFVGFFFRKKHLPLIMLMPVLFGGFFSLAVIALTSGTISAIALGAGSIVLGIAINYSLHFFSHYKHCGSIEQTISDLLSPMTLGSITTVASFFSLTLLRSRILNDLGLFAGLSLSGATIFALVFLPHFVPKQEENAIDVEESKLEKMLDFKIRYPGILFLIILVLTVFLFHYAGKVSFQSDLTSMNFIDDETCRARKEIDITQDDTSKLVFIAVSGTTSEEMWQNNELLMKQLEEARKKGWIQKYSSLSKFIPSNELQEERIKRWNSYWTKEKKEKLLSVLDLDGTRAGFTANAFKHFKALLNKEYLPASLQDFAPIIRTLGSEYLISSNDKQIIINGVRVDKLQRKSLYDELRKNPFTAILDKQIITNSFVEIIMNDFNSILLYTSLLVFLALFFSYGRLELTFITFLPMVIAWVWILGIMGLFGFQFNLINIIISTFIFGLGDDFSIFITDGLTEKFKMGKETLASHKVSIFLSAVTILIGLGALIFAKHPALRSIALVSIIGIFCVVVIGQTVQPFLYNFFIQNRKEHGLPPWTIPTLILFWIAFGYYVVISLLTTIVGYILLYLIPYPGIKKRKLFFHHLVCYALRVLTYMMTNVSKRHIGRENMDFSKPAIIIANHTSFLDILVTVMQHPKLILLTNKWVYYSPVFGKVVQLADYYPVMEGVDPGIQKFADIVKDGYSIVIFPEGTRSPHGMLKRFHKGAFYLAEQFRLDIVPLLLHGTTDTIRKGDFMVMNSFMTMKFLPRISSGDKRFGEGYVERTKRISRYFKEEFEKLKEENETPRYFRQRLRMNYIYKGLKLEWLAIRESRKEKFYESLNKILPKDGMITLLGCGYGFTSYMLHFTGWRRMITGVDVDEEKIAVASNCYSKNERINFVYANAMTYSLPRSRAFVLSQQNLLLNQLDTYALIERCKENLEEDGRIIFIGEQQYLTDFSTENIFDSVYLIHSEGK